MRLPAGWPLAGASVVVNGRTEAKVEAAVAGDRQGGARQQDPGRRRRRLDGGRMQRPGRGAARVGHPDQQCRDLRTQGVLRHSRRRLEPLLRGQCDVGRAAFARLSAGHAEAQLGPHRFHLLGIRAEHPEGNDPLRHDQDRAAGGIARACRDDPRHRRHRQFGAAGTDHVGGRRNLRQGSRQAERPVAGGGGVAVRQAVSPDLAAAALCHRRGDRQHGGLCLLEEPRRPTAPHFAPRAASSRPSREFAHFDPMSFPKSMCTMPRASRTIGTLRTRPSRNMAGIIWSAAASPAWPRAGRRRTRHRRRDSLRCRDCAGGAPLRDTPKY